MLYTIISCIVSVDIDPALVLVFQGLEVSAKRPPSFGLVLTFLQRRCLPSEVVLLVLRQDAWNATGLYHLV